MPYYDYKERKQPIQVWPSRKKLERDWKRWFYLNRVTIDGRFGRPRRAKGKHRRTFRPKSTSWFW